MRIIRGIISRVNKYWYICRLYWYRRMLKTGRFDNNGSIADISFDAEWEGRIKKVINSEYNTSIPRVSDAGTINKGFQKMHNGIEISTGEYYGLPITKMLYLNKGVHEPEEEKIFQTVLSLMPRDAVMVELGAYWAFYSMWFLREVPAGRVYMIEPEKKHLEIGRMNFRRNNFLGKFDQHFIGRTSENGEISTVCLDDYAAKNNLTRINIAHSDIQGFELDMLEGATTLLQKRAIDFFFISTHYNELHYKCIDFLQQQGYKIIFQLDLDNVSSFDGFILAVSPGLEESAKQQILN